MELNSAAQISVSNLTFAYNRGAPVLKGLHCEISVGEKIAVLGHNGAGKTTFFNVLSGLAQGYQGSVLLNGSELKKTQPGCSSAQNRVGTAETRTSFPFSDP